MSLYDFIEDIFQKLRKTKYERDVYFRIADEYQGLLPVEILKGHYKGTIFIVTGIHVLDDYGHSKYDVDIIKKTGVKYGDAFHKIAGDILLICINEAQSNRLQLRHDVLADDAEEAEYLEEPVEPRTK